MHRSFGCILISSDRGEGRCSQRLADRWWWVVGLRMGRIGGWVVGQISSSQLWGRNKLIWQWQMNHLLSPNCQFYASRTPSSHSVCLFPIPHYFLLERPQPLSPSFSPTKLLLSLNFPCPHSFFCAFLLFFPWCPFISLPATITFPILFIFFLLLLQKYRRFLHLKRSCCIFITQ